MGDRRHGSDRVSDGVAARPAFARAVLVVATLSFGVAFAQGGARRAAASAASSPAGRPPASVFHIAKSENRNQVHYGVRVDDDCRPVGATPVYGYWRDFEVGPSARSELLDREQPAYGLTRPRFVEHRDEGGTVSIGLRGFPDRSIRVETFREGESCRARALTKIGGQVAVLNHIYVELGLLFSIDYVIVRGLRLPDGRPIQEKVDE